MTGPKPTLRLESDLLVDTGFGQRSAGLRNASGDRRQLLFRAGDIYLDLSLHRQAGSTGLALMGQLMDGGSASRNLADLPVEVDLANGERASTRSNGLGEFLLTCLPEGATTLGVSIDRWTSFEVSLPVAGTGATEGGR